MKNNLIAIALIAVLGCGVYFNSLNGAFLWDDDILIKNNLFIRNPSNITALFTTDTQAGAGRIGYFYRPIQVLSYMVDYSLTKLEPFGYHLTNMLLHILTAVGIYFFIRLLLYDNLISLLTALFFVVHPVHTEAVSYISGRSESLGFLFILLSFIFYIRFVKNRGLFNFFLAIAVYTCALLSRENSLIFPLLLLVYHYAFRERINKKIFTAILSITCVYVLIRVTLLGSLLSSVQHSTTFFERLPGFFAAITQYLRLLVLPLNQHMEYGARLVAWSDLRVIIGVVIVLFLAFLFFKNRRRNKILVFSVFWFFTALLPVSNLYPINAYMAEHWLYMPSLGVFLMSGCGCAYFLRRRNLHVLCSVLIIGFLFFYSFLTIRQNNYWHDAMWFYERTLEYAPDSARLLSNLGVEYNKLGANEKSIALYKKAVSFNPKFEEAYNNLGYAYKEAGRNEEAIGSYQKSIDANPNFAEGYYNLGVLYSETGKLKEALPLYEKAIELNPNYASAYNNLGLAFSGLDNDVEAAVLYKKAIKLDPAYAVAYYNLGNLYQKAGDKKQAVVFYQKAIVANPNLVQAYNNLGVMNMLLGKDQEAEACFIKAAQLSSDNAAARGNLASVYYNMGKYGQALEWLDKALALGFNPDSPVVNALKPYRKEKAR